MNTPVISRILAVVALLFSSLFFTMAPAAAAPADTENIPNICQVQASMDEGTKDTGLLPVNRWQEATTVFHSNLDEAFWKAR